MFLQLTYSSHAVHPLGHVSDLGILRHALEHNANAGLTGYLVRDSTHFLQTLEGEHIQVRALFSRICRDHRHFSVHTLLERELPQRMFADWSMGYSELRNEDLTQAKNEALAQAQKNPAEAGRVVDFLREVAVA